MESSEVTLSKNWGNGRQTVRGNWENKDTAATMRGKGNPYSSKTTDKVVVTPSKIKKTDSYSCLVYRKFPHHFSSLHE